ncbi:hypothetical protein SAMN06265222_101832 [Neorhodopirellula lusitana]|uniref:Secreted protein n=1 Tax=Neorhodopirellula lusitana TaxID=445327 RepID=A0ABY1PRP9_9BACT|nr:hypothetical protein [Neorhodopirellula lusitana]SMP42738.1 hypothetical protein SAMN06265222_101832 [Neorhodopirellula lusitana]
MRRIPMPAFSLLFSVTTLCATAFCVVTLGVTAFGQEPTPIPSTTEASVEVVPSESAEQPLDFWMKKKLDYSTGILKGLSMGDFDLIETNANQMRLLNRVEGFVRSRNTGYRGHLRSFERVTDEVIHQAQKQNIEGVTLAYHQLTVSCVRCHQSLRESE